MLFVLSVRSVCLDVCSFACLSVSCRAVCLCLGLCHRPCHWLCFCFCLWLCFCLCDYLCLVLRFLFLFLFLLQFMFLPLSLPSLSASLYLSLSVCLRAFSVCWSVLRFINVSVNWSVCIHPVCLSAGSSVFHPFDCVFGCLYDHIPIHSFLHASYMFGRPGAIFRLFRLLCDCLTIFIFLLVSLRLFPYLSNSQLKYVCFALFNKDSFAFGAAGMSSKLM